MSIAHDIIDYAEDLGKLDLLDKALVTPGRLKQLNSSCGNPMTPTEFELMCSALELSPRDLAQGNFVSIGRPGSNQVYSDGEFCWKVDRLIELSRDLDRFEIPLTELAELIPKWSAWENPFTIKDAVDHFRRVQKSDLTYPIILSEDGWIMDGCHRIVKAFIEGRSTITAVRFKKNPEPDFLAERKPDESLSVQV